MLRVAISPVCFILVLSLISMFLRARNLANRKKYLSEEPKQNSGRGLVPTVIYCWPLRWLFCFGSFVVLGVMCGDILLLLFSKI